MFLYIICPRDIRSALFVFKYILEISNLEIRVFSICSSNSAYIYTYWILHQSFKERTPVIPISAPDTTTAPFYVDILILISIYIIKICRNPSGLLLRHRVNRRYFRFCHWRVGLLSPSRRSGTPKHIIPGGCKSGTGESSKRMLCGKPECLERTVCGLDAHIGSDSAHST